VACVLEKAVAGFDPASGRLLWSHPHENRGGDITSTLIWGPDNLLFFSGAYQGGSRTLQLSRQNGSTMVKQLWFHSQLRVHHTNVMRIGDYVYASNGDFGGTETLYCRTVLKRPFDDRPRGSRRVGLGPIPVTELPRSR
jgi:hypothetical protein